MTWTYKGAHARVRPKAQWWFAEDWKIVAGALQFAACYAQPFGVQRWRMDMLIEFAERERDESLGAMVRERVKTRESSRKYRARKHLDRVTRRRLRLQTASWQPATGQTAS